jgi:hypothetical protein
MDWDAADPTIELEVHTGRGDVGLKKRLTLSQLRPSNAPHR